MSINRIIAVIYQELYITKRSLEVIVDLFMMSALNVIVFGFVSLFLNQAVEGPAANYLFLGIILMEIMRITQYSITVGALWNIWSRNLSNVFIAPLTIREYLTAHILSGSIKALLTFLIISLAATFIFQFNIFSLGFTNLALFFINLSIFSWSLGIGLLGLIFRFGTRIQALAWGFIYLMQPLTAAFFPVSVLPTWLQYLAYLFPSTHVFEAARAALTSSRVDWLSALTAFLLNILYLLLSLWIFDRMFKTSKKN